MKSGDILVCELTDPEWTPLFSLAGGVVADTGSSLSHAAVVAQLSSAAMPLSLFFTTAPNISGSSLFRDVSKRTFLF